VNSRERWYNGRPARVRKSCAKEAKVFVMAFDETLGARGAVIFFNRRWTGGGRTQRRVCAKLRDIRAKRLAHTNGW